MLKLSSTFLLIAIFNYCCAQELIPYLDGEYYGYSGLNGKIVIEPVFSEATLFNEDGIAHVRKGDKWSIIHKTGKVILPWNSDQKIKLQLVINAKDKRSIYPKFITIDTLHQLRIEHFLDKKFRIINIKNGTATPFYIARNPFRSSGMLPAHIIRFNHGLLVGKIATNKFEVINIQGERILICESAPKIWNAQLITYRKGNQTILFNPQKRTQNALPYKTVHTIINGQLFIVSNAQSSGAWHFRNGKPLFKQSLVNQDGKLLIDSIYENLLNHHGHYFIAKKHKEVQIIDTLGKVLNPTIFLNAYPLNQKFVAAQLENKKWVLLDQSGKHLSQEQYDKVEYHSNGNYYTFQEGDIAGVLDENLQKLIEYEADAIYQSELSDLFYINIDEKIGVINTKKQFIILPKYDHCYFVKEKYFRLTLDEKIGLAKIDGTILFEPEYEDVYVELKNGITFFWPKKNQRYACFDTQLSQLSGFVHRHSYTDGRPISWERQNKEVFYYDSDGEPIGFPTKQLNRSGYVDADSTFLVFLRKGKFLHILRPDGKFVNGQNQKLHYMDSELNLSAGLFGVKVEKEEGVLNHKAQWILPLGEQKIHSISGQTIVVKRAKQYYIYDHNGRLIHEKPFDYVSDYNGEGLRAVARNIPGKSYQYIMNSCFDGKIDTLIRFHKNYGFIDQSGKIVIPLKYNQARGYFEKYAWVAKGFERGKKTSYIINREGNILLESPFDVLHPLHNSHKSNYYITTINSKRGIIDKTGKEIIPPEYQSIDGYVETTFFKAMDDFDNWHIINRSNEVVIKNVKKFYSDKYGAFSTLPNNRYLIYPNGQSMIIGKDGKILKIIESQNVEVISATSQYPLLLKIRENNKEYYLNLDTLIEYKSPSK